MVHANTSLEPIQKLQYLLNAVSGDALKVIASLEITNENYLIARTLLINRFQHTRRLVNTFLKKLFDYPKFQHESAESIKEFVDNITDCSTSLQKLNISVLDYQLIFHMVRKLPHKTANEWQKSLGSASALPDIKTFILFLEDKYRTLENVEDGIEQNPKKSAKVFHSNKSNYQIDETKPPQNPVTLDSQNKLYTIENPNKKSCLCCRGEHFLGNCDKFRKLLQHEGFEFIKKNKCCINCLDKSHMLLACKSFFL